MFPKLILLNTRMKLSRYIGGLQRGFQRMKLLKFRELTDTGGYLAMVRVTLLRNHCDWMTSSRMIATHRADTRTRVCSTESHLIDSRKISFVRYKILNVRTYLFDKIMIQVFKFVGYLNIIEFIIVNIVSFQVDYILLNILNKRRSQVGTLDSDSETIYMIK